MINIGVFDSGVGGLWILEKLQQKLPGYNYIFIGDQGHVPYGNRNIEEIRDFSLGISNFLMEHKSKIIVIACNTASAVSLKYLRAKFPDVFFVGMEPAIKPAVEYTKTLHVGVLATHATFQGQLYNSVVEKFASNVEIYKDTCPMLVEQIENGDFDTLKTKQILKKALNPMLMKNVDTIVLGCTHYPFVINEIQNIVGSFIKVIDPTFAIINRVSNILLENKLKEEDNGNVLILTSGNISKIKIVADKLFFKNLTYGEVIWSNDLILKIIK